MRIYLKGARSVYILNKEMGAMKILIVEDEVLNVYSNANGESYLNLKVFDMNSNIPLGFIYWQGLFKTCLIALKKKKGFI